jgi:hypothetical protein
VETWAEAENVAIISDSRAHEPDRVENHEHLITVVEASRTAEGHKSGFSIEPLAAASCSCGPFRNFNAAGQQRFS